MKTTLIFFALLIFLAFGQDAQTKPHFPRFLNMKAAERTLEDYELLEEKYSKERYDELQQEWSDLIEENVEKGSPEWDSYVVRVKTLEKRFTQFEQERLEVIRKMENDAEKCLKKKYRRSTDDATTFDVSSEEDHINVLEAETENFFRDAWNTGRNAVGGIVNGARQWGGEVVRDVRAVANPDNWRAAGRDFMDAARATGRTVMDGGRTAGALLSGDRDAARRHFQSMQNNGQQAINAGTRVYNNPAVQGAIDLAHKGRQVYQAVQSGGTSLIAPALMAAGQGVMQGNTRFNGVPDFNRVEAPQFRDLARNGAQHLMNRAIGGAANWAANRLGAPVGDRLGQFAQNNLGRLANNLSPNLRNFAQQGLNRLNIPGRVSNFVQDQVRNAVTNQGNRARDWVNNQFSNGFPVADQIRNMRQNAQGAFNNFRQNPQAAFNNMRQQAGNWARQGMDNLRQNAGNWARQGMSNLAQQGINRFSQFAGQQAGNLGNRFGQFAQDRLSGLTNRLPPQFQGLAQQGLNRLNLPGRFQNFAQQQGQRLAQNFGNQARNFAQNQFNQFRQNGGFQGLGNRMSQGFNNFRQQAQNQFNQFRQSGLGQQFGQGMNQLRQQAGNWARQGMDQIRQNAGRWAQQGFNGLANQGINRLSQFAGQQAGRLGNRFGQFAQDRLSGLANRLPPQFRGMAQQGLNRLNLPGRLQNFAQNQAQRLTQRVGGQLRDRIGGAINNRVNGMFNRGRPQTRPRPGQRPQQRPQTRPRPQQRPQQRPRQQPRGRQPQRQPQRARQPQRQQQRPRQQSRPQQRPRQQQPQRARQQQSRSPSSSRR